MTSWSTLARSTASLLLSSLFLVLPASCWAATSQTISFSPIPAQAVGSSLTVSATASSGLPVTFSLVQNGNCSISGSVVTFLNVGNCGVIANQAGNSTYSAAPAVGQIIVVNNVSKQTITFNPIPSQAVGGSLTVSATASSGLPVSFSIVPNGNCSISGTTLTFLNVGNCGVVANQAGNSAYSAAPAVGQIIVVNNVSKQTITFNPIPSQVVGGTLTVSATASSGLPVSFSIVPNGNCSISGTTLTFLNVGNCGVVANQAGNGSYQAAPAVGQIIVVNSATAQSITFSPIASQQVGSQLSLNATATSGLAVSFASSTASVCTTSGSTASLLSTGTCTIVASQAGNSTYSAASPVSQSFTVTASGSGTNTPVATSAYSTICQAQQTASYCTDQTPGPADANGYHSFTSWTNLNKVLTSIAVSDDQVWGVDSNQVLWFLPDFKTGTNWTQVATGVTQVSAGHGLVCQINSNQHVYCASSPNPTNAAVGWVDTGATNYKQIAVSAGKQFWAIDNNTNLIQIKDYTRLASTATEVASGVLQVAVDGRGVICQVNSNHYVYCSNWSAPASTPSPAPYYGLPWVETSSQLQHISVADGEVYGTDTNGDVWLLQDYGNSSTWFKIAHGGTGTLTSAASIPSQFQNADFAAGDVAVLLFMGQSNAVGVNVLPARFISQSSPNVWGIQNGGWNYLPGNTNGTNPFNSPISSIASVQWSNYALTPTSADMNLGFNNDAGPGGDAANFSAYQWQGLINAGWQLPDLYIIHIAWASQGVDAADTTTASAAWTTHGVNLWQPTLNPSQEPSYALAPFARRIVYLALQNLLANSKNPRLIGLQWNQWEAEAGNSNSVSISDAPTNYTNLVNGFYTAIGTHFPIQFAKPLSTAYGAAPLSEMQTVFANLISNDPTDLSEIDVSQVSSTIFSGGIFGGGDGSVHYNLDTHKWFAQQAIGLCLIQGNCGVRVTALPSSTPN